MISIDQLRKLALSLPETTEEPHFDKSSFRVKKKIFVTYDSGQNFANIKLTPTDQDIFCLGDHGISPVPNKWGKQGWTNVDMNIVRIELFRDTIRSAYCTVAPKKLANIVKSG